MQMCSARNLLGHGSPAIRCKGRGVRGGAGGVAVLRPPMLYCTICYAMLYHTVCSTIM